MYIYLISAPLCPPPPEIPFEGKVTNDPIVFEMTDSNSCGVDGKDFSINCFSFMNIYARK